MHRSNNDFSFRKQSERHFKQSGSSLIRNMMNIPSTEGVNKDGSKTNKINHHHDHGIFSVHRIPVVELEDNCDAPPPVETCKGFKAMLLRSVQMPVAVLVGITTLMVSLVPLTLFLSYRLGEPGLQMRSDVEPVGGDPFPFDLEAKLEHPITSLRDVSEYPVAPNDVPFLWIVPQSGATAIAGILQNCYRLRSPKQMGVDTFTTRGLQQMIDQKYIFRDDVDFIESAYLFEAAEAFGSDRPGRLVASFRHPHDRILSGFRDKKNAGDPLFVNVTFGEYLRKGQVANNWMTRFLTNKRRGDLTSDDLVEAKNLVYRKCLVLLMEKPIQSVVHMRTFFGWKDLGESWNCTNTMLRDDDREGNVERPLRDSEEWRMLDELNKYDLLLYRFLEDVFDIQAAQLGLDFPPHPSS